MTALSLVPALCLAAFLAPSLAFASTTTDLVSQLAGLIYVIAGVGFMASFLLMLGGFVMWLARLGTFPTHRDEGIVLMEWGIATLFVLILFLGVAEFVQSHTSVVLYLIVLAVVALLLWVVLASFGGEKKEKEGE